MISRYESSEPARAVADSHHADPFRRSARLFLFPLLLVSGIRNAGQIAYANAAFGQAAPITAWALPLWQNASNLLPAEQRAAEQRVLARAVWANGDDIAAATILGLGAEATPAHLATYFQPDWSAAGQTLPDALAARDLANAAAALSAGDEASAAQWLDAALVLRPDDLYANYQRWRVAGSATLSEHHPVRVVTPQIPRPPTSSSSPSAHSSLPMPLSRILPSQLRLRWLRNESGHLSNSNVRQAYGSGNTPNCPPG
ncbi:MAG: hypothetical protein IPK16_12140 [Anaerolineales bacterium]|nr:hypothetical protein [Anaerolineales bacterium]